MTILYVLMIVAVFVFLVLLMTVFIPLTATAFAEGEGAFRYPEFVGEDGRPGPRNPLRILYDPFYRWGYRAARRKRDRIARRDAERKRSGELTLAEKLAREGVK